MWKLLLLVAVSSATSVPQCPRGFTYHPEFNSCYTLVDKPTEYSVAEQNCVNLGGHLASIGSEKENRFVEIVTKSSNRYPAELYSWIGAPETEYTNWAPRQNTLDGCTAQTSCGGIWAKVDCTYTAPYVCKTAPRSCPECPTCPALHSYCDSTWTYFEESDSCYKGFFKASWDDAEETCKSYDSHLTSIHSDEENEFIFDLVTMGIEGKSTDSIFTWIGLHRNPQGSDNFEFVDGTEFDTEVFNKWAPGEPNNSKGNENCVELYSELNPLKPTVFKLWNDQNCKHVHRRFVCKKNAYNG